MAELTESIQKYWEPKAWLVALEVVTQATLSAGSRSLSLRLSQHHHNKRRSPWAWGGGKVCRDNRRGRIFYRRQSRGSAVGRNRETIVSGRANGRLRVPGVLGSSEGHTKGWEWECGVCTAQRHLAKKRRVACWLGVHRKRVAESLPRSHTASGRGEPGRVGTAWFSSLTEPGFKPGFLLPLRL